MILAIVLGISLLGGVASFLVAAEWRIPAFVLVVVLLAPAVINRYIRRSTQPFGWFAGEETTLREMRRMRRVDRKTGEQRSFAEIARELNRRRLFARDEQLWKSHTVQATLESAPPRGGRRDLRRP